MKKRIVSFLLALVMAVSLLPVSAFAAEDAASPDVPAVVEQAQEVQTVEEQQDEDIVVEDNGIQTYADDGSVTLSIKADGVYNGDTKLDAISDKVTPIATKPAVLGTLKVSTTYVYTAERAEHVTVKNESGILFGPKSSGYLDVDSGSGLAFRKNKEKTLGNDRGQLKAVADSNNLEKAGLKNYEKGCSQYYYFCFKYSEDSIFGLLIQIKPTVKETDKTALNAAIASVTGENAAKYFQSDDRWNGNATSENGFWSDMLPKLTAAQTVAADNTASQTEVDAAAAALQAAIDNLIPTSRVNATALYEALNTDWRWNPGNSLQEGWPENTLWEKPSADNCTSLSWQPYAKALKDGRALLEQLYKDGNPTDENTDTKQEAVDKLAAAADAHKLVNKEAYAAAYDKYMAAKPEAEALLQQYDPAKLTESDYTADSWKTYTDAYAVLKTDLAYRIVGGTTEDYAMLSSFSQHMTALKNAYRQLTSATDVTVSFTYINNFSALYPGFGGTSLYTNSSLTLAAGSANLLGAYNAANIELDTHEDKSLPGYYYINTGDTNPQFLVFINGSCAGLYIWSFRDSTLYPQYALSAVQLHNGDSVKMVRVAMPLFNKEDSSGLDSSAWNLLSASEEHYQSSVALIDMTAPGSAKVGDKATFSATVTGANTTNLGSGKSAAGITLFISDPSETEALSQPIHKTAATGADGSLQYVFTKPGWYTVAMFNVTPDDYTRVDIYGSTNAIGEYYSLYGGDYALIHVTEADDTDALLKQYRTEKAAEAKVYFDNFHDYDFTAEGYAALKAQYETLTANLQKATDLTALMETYDADFAQLKELGAAAIDHAAVIAGLRQNLSYLPDDLNDLNANYKTLVKDIQTVYGGLNSYQKKLLSANETKRLDAVAKIDAGSLKVPAKVTLEVDVDENQLPKKSGGGNPYFGWPNIKWVVTPNVDGTLPAPNWAYPSFGTAKAGDHAFIRYYLDTTDAKYWPVWSVDGGTTWNLMEPQTLVTPNDEKTAYDGYYLAEYVIPGDVVDGSTITFKVKMISKTEYQAMTADSEETVAAARSAALSRLQTLYNSLGDKAKEAYDEGVKNINAASSAAAIDRLYQAAAVAMREAANNYGKVRVIVENTTFTEDMWPNGKKFWDGVAVNDEVALTADSTMMSCIVAALEDNGYTQAGADSNYISSITVGDRPLGQFDGGQQSGWMGTLNDWFTNEGFAAFTVANGKLADGDVIRVMFTLNGYGADLGGTWANSDTTLSALKVTGGKLAPNFVSGEAGGRYDYTLVIDGDSGSIRLSPTAANKNFQVKAFLNEKVTDMTEGSSFFKRTESIPVKVGDTIYVGCGAKGWLSMNNQSGNTQTSDGTWYVLHVVSADTGADYVVGLINDLPAAVKYENYSAAENAVFAARAAYGILSKTEQSKVSNLAKLEKLEQAIAGFRSVDTLKAQISNLPEADKLSMADSQAVAAAEKMFLALTTEQKDCLTIAEVEKAEAVFAEMKRILEAPIKDAEAKIDAIGEVTLERGEAVLTAQAAFNALTPEQQAQVSNADKLQSAVAKLAALRKAVLTEKLDEPYKTTGDFMATLGTPTVNSIGGEWMVIGLARSGRTVPAGYYDNVVEYVKAKADANERLHPAKVTDNARVILALTSIGKDVTNVGGHNLLKGLDNMAYVQTQGINGPIWALIALDSHNYPTMGDVTREKLIQVILDAQLTDGGWDLSAENADTDMTAMAIQALAPYYKTNETVKAAVDKALEALSALQRNDGGFGSWGTVNSESCDQVIVALTALGIDPIIDSRFIKNGHTVLDALVGFYVTGGGFRHTAGGERNGMATEQGYYALAAYYRFVNAQTRLYDMSDVAIQTGGSNTPATGDTGVLVWIIALPVAALAAAFVLKRKEREA